MIPCRTPMCKAHGGMRCLNVTVCYLARRRRRRGGLQAKVIIPWLMVTWAMPHFWVGVAPVWLPPFAVEDRDAASDASASAKRDCDE
jgi:hypothetical protein